MGVVFNLPDLIWLYIHFGCQSSHIFHTPENVVTGLVALFYLLEQSSCPSELSIKLLSVQDLCLWWLNLHALFATYKHVIDIL